PEDSPKLFIAAVESGGADAKNSVQSIALNSGVLAIRGIVTAAHHSPLRFCCTRDQQWLFIEIAPRDHYSLPWEGLFSAIRGFGYGSGLYRILGFRYAIAFAILVTIGQVFAYSHGMRPAIDYEAARRPRLSRR